MQLHLFRFPFPFSPPLVWRMLDSLNSLTCGVLAPLSQTPCLYLGRRSYWPGSSYFAPGFSFEVASTNTGSSLEQAFQLRRYSPGSISPPECPRKCVTQCDVFPIPGFQFGTKMPSHSLLTFFFFVTHNRPIKVKEKEEEIGSGNVGKAIGSLFHLVLTKLLQLLFNCELRQRSCWEQWSNFWNIIKFRYENTL